MRLKHIFFAILILSITGCSGNKLMTNLGKIITGNDNLLVESWDPSKIDCASSGIVLVKTTPLIHESYFRSFWGLEKVINEDPYRAGRLVGVIHNNRLVDDKYILVAIPPGRYLLTYNLQVVNLQPNSPRSETKDTFKKFFDIKGAELAYLGSFRPKTHTSDNGYSATIWLEDIGLSCDLEKDFGWFNKKYPSLSQNLKVVDMSKIKPG